MYIHIYKYAYNVRYMIRYISLFNVFLHPSVFLSIYLFIGLPRTMYAYIYRVNPRYTLNEIYRFL